MPVVHDIHLDLELEEVLRWQGIKEYSRHKSEIETLTRELLISVKRSHLLESAITYETYPITEAGSQQISLGGNAKLHGSLLPSVLREAKQLVVAVCTIGPKLERQVTDSFNNNEPLQGLLLDGIGNAAVDSVASEVCKLMVYEASLHGYQVSSPLSPGGPAFPISEQWHLFELVQTEEIGVSLTHSGVMVPRKSLSMVIGMGPQMPTWTKAQACTHCNLIKTCRYRLRV